MYASTRPPGRAARHSLARHAGVVEWWARCWGFVLRGAGVSPADRVFFPFSFACSSASGRASRAPGARRARDSRGAQDSRRDWPGWNPGATVLVCTPLLCSPPPRGGPRARHRPEKLLSGRPSRGSPGPGSRRSGLASRPLGTPARSPRRHDRDGGLRLRVLRAGRSHVNESEFILEVVRPGHG